MIQIQINIFTKNKKSGKMISMETKMFADSKATKAEFTIADILLKLFIGDLKNAKDAYLKSLQSTPQNGGDQ